MSKKVIESRPAEIKRENEYSIGSDRQGTIIFFTNQYGETDKKSFTGSTREIVNEKIYQWMLKYELLKAPEKQINSDSLVEDFVMEFKLNYLVPRVGRDYTSRTYTQNYAPVLDLFEQYFRGRKIGTIKATQLILIPN